MSKLLYLKCSPRKERSYSNAAADAFIASYKEKNPEDKIETLNLFERELPRFDGLALQAKYAILHGEKHTDEELAAWRAVETIIDEFKSADKYLFSVPMWNFLIPYQLKHYIDILVQPTYTFGFTEEGAYVGLVTGKPALLICSRGGEYPEGSEAEAFDFQTKYLKTILGFIGFTDIKSLIVEPTLAGGPDTAREKREAAIHKAKEMAGLF